MGTVKSARLSIRSVWLMRARHYPKKLGRNQPGGSTSQIVVAEATDSRLEGLGMYRLHSFYNEAPVLRVSAVACVYSVIDESLR